MTMRLLSLLWVVAFAATCTPVLLPTNPPPDPPTFQKVAPSMGGTSISWHNPTDTDFDATLVVRYAGARDGKASGPVPNAGDTFGSGTVVYAGTDTSTFDTLLPPGCASFTYEFWAHDHKGQWSEVSVIATTLPGGLPGPATGPTMLAATAVSGSVQLSWVSPAASSGATQSRIVRQLGMPAVSAQLGTPVYEGTASAANDDLATLPRGQTLFYSAFGCNACDACSALSSSASVLIPQNGFDAGVPDGGPETADGGTELQPTGMAAALSTDGQTVQLSWTNPTAAAFTQVKVMRQLNAPPAGPNDGTATTLFTGLATSTQERLDQLLPASPGTPRTYYYVVYGCADLACESQGAQAMFSATLQQALRGGGYTLWWRHLPASDCSDLVNLGVCTMSGSNWTCPANGWWKTCDDDVPACSVATARQLTPSSSDIEAQTIHDQFNMKHFPVGRVLASEFCRAQHSVSSWHDSANMLHPGFDFGPSIESVKELTYYVYDEANRCANTTTLLNQAPAQGTNTAMVSHAGFSCSVNGGRIDSLNWGDCAIFKPSGSGGPVYIQTVSYDGWAQLP